MDSKLYPFKCDPILKEKLWGGNQLRDFLGKTTSSNKFGESWEVASLPEGNSTIANGRYRGKSLKEIVATSSKAILGAKVVERFGTDMPLLIKFIDASKKLSVQLHPNDTLAQELHDKPRGKTEMWYVLKADKNAHIIAGFNEPMDTENFQKALNDGTLEQKLKRLPVKEGDAFFIPAGLIHAIGEGIVLAEIQQTSDITYRVYDYNRKQKDGSYRALHLDNAIKALKFPSLMEVCLDYKLDKLGAQVLKESRFFTTKIVWIRDTSHSIDRKETFTILICVQGEGLIRYDKKKYLIQKGDTYIVPAICDHVALSGQDVKFLEVYM